MFLDRTTKTINECVTQPDLLEDVNLQVMVSVLVLERGLAKFGTPGMSQYLLVQNCEGSPHYTIIKLLGPVLCWATGGMFEKLDHGPLFLEEA